MASQIQYLRDNVFWILCVMGSFAILSSTMSKNPVLKPFATSLGTPSDLLGIVASASTIPGIIVSLPAASLSDIFGRRRILLVSTFVFASAPFLYLLINTWWQLVIIRFYHGFATAIFVPITEAYVAELFPSKRGERISIFSSVTAVGRGVAPFLGGYILYLTDYGYHTLYLAVGIAGVTAFVVTLLFMTEQKSLTIQVGGSRETARRMFHGWWSVIKNRGVLIVSFIQASQYYAYGAAEFFLVGYLQTIKLDALSIGTVTGSQVIALIVARPFMGRLSDKIGRHIPIILGSLISGLILLVIPYSSQFTLLVALSIMYGFGFALAISSTSPLMSEYAPPDLVGTSMGFLSTMMDVGQTLGPIISGLILATSLQYVGLFYSLCLLLIFSCVLFVLLRVYKKEKTFVMTGDKKK